MGSQNTITFGIKSTMFTLFYSQSLSLFPTCIYGTSLCTLPMVVYLIGTSGDSIYEPCAHNLWVTRNIIRKRVQVKKIGAQIDVDCWAKGQG